MPPLNLAWRVWGRPVKPVAFGLMVSLVVVTVATATNVGVLAGTWARGVGFAAAAGAVILAAGWVTRSQRLAVTGLLIAFVVWGFRACLVALVAPDPWATESLWLSFGWAAIAAGSYMLEIADTLPGAARDPRST